MSSNGLPLDVMLNNAFCIEPHQLSYLWLRLLHGLKRKRKERSRTTITLTFSYDFFYLYSPLKEIGQATVTLFPLFNSLSDES